MLEYICHWFRFYNLKEITSASGVTQYTMKYDIVVDTLMMLHQDENQAVVIYYADLWYMLSLILGNIHKQLKQWDSSPETENNPREVQVMQQCGAIQRMHILHREKSVDTGAKKLVLKYKTSVL